jgi:hypothetical protein
METVLCAAVGAASHQHELETFIMCVADGVQPTELMCTKLAYGFIRFSF